MCMRQYSSLLEELYADYCHIFYSSLFDPPVRQHGGRVDVQRLLN